MRARFCAYYACKDEDFEIHALRKGMHQPWGHWAYLVLRLAPGMLRTDIQILRQLARAKSSAEWAKEIRGLRGDYLRHKDAGFWRRALRFRLSGERLLRLEIVFRADSKVPRAKISQSFPVL